MSIKGTKTESNLLKAFAGESQARNRYTYFAKQAKKEGYEQVAAIFTETADNEMVHAKRFFRFLEGGELEITAAFPAGVIGTTVENLTAAASGENHEHTTIYPEFAKVAQEEGFKEVAAAFRAIAIAEEAHEKRYLALKKAIEKDMAFKRSEPVKWKCRVCGYTSTGKDAPLKCPGCEHPQSHFEIAAENF